MEKEQLKKVFAIAFMLMFLTVYARDFTMGSWNVDVKKSNGMYNVTSLATDNSWEMNNEIDYYIPEGDGKGENTFYITARARLGKGSKSNVLCVAYTYWNVTAGRVTVDKFAEITLSEDKYTYINEKYSCSTGYEGGDARITFYLKSSYENDSYIIGDFNCRTEVKTADGIPGECCKAVPRGRYLAVVFDKPLKRDSVEKRGNVQINNSLELVEKAYLAGDRTVVVKLKRIPEKGRRYVLDFLDIEAADKGTYSNSRLCFTMSDETNFSDKVVADKSGTVVNIGGGAVDIQVAAAEYEGNKLKTLETETYTLKSGEVLHGISADSTDGNKVFLICGGEIAMSN